MRSRGLGGIRDPGIEIAFKTTQLGVQGLSRLPTVENLCELSIRLGSGIPEKVKPVVIAGRDLTPSATLIWEPPDVVKIAGSRTPGVDKRLHSMAEEGIVENVTAVNTIV